MAAAAAAAGETPPPQANYFFGRPWPELNEGLSYTDTFRGSDAEATATLIDFYSENYKSSAPLPGWIHRIRNGQITVDDQVVTDPDMILREGSKLVYHRLAWKEPFAPHLLQVLYEDDDMVALNKPSGLQVLSKGLFQQRTVLAQLQWKEWKMPPSSCSKKKKVQLHPVPVHRLGRGTSGLLLCAKTKLAKVQLASYFAEGAANAEKKRDGTEVGKEQKISKFYRALVTGILEHDKDVVTQPIGLVHYPGVAEGLYVACSSGKPAMSKVCVLERLAHQNQTLVQVEIHSGRPNQIRIHLAYIGHPLVDDPLYAIGGQPKFHDLESTSTDVSFAYDGGYERPLQPVPGDCGYHLHAHWLVLSHPTTNKMVKITAPLPHILQTREERCDQQRETGCTLNCKCKDCHNPFGAREAGVSKAGPGQTSPPSSTEMKPKRCHCKVNRCRNKSCYCVKHEVGCTSYCKCQGCDNPKGAKGSESNTGSGGADGVGNIPDEAVQTTTPSITEPGQVDTSSMAYCLDQPARPMSEWPGFEVTVGFRHTRA